MLRLLEERFGSPGQPCFDRGLIPLPPRVTKRDETSELLLAGKSLVASSLVGINEKRGKGGGRARPDWRRNEGIVCSSTQ